MSVLLLGADGKPGCEQKEDRHISNGIKEDDKPILLLAKLTKRRGMGSLTPRRIYSLVPRRRTSLLIRRTMKSSVPKRRSSLSYLYW